MRGWTRWDDELLSLMRLNSLIGEVAQRGVAQVGGGVALVQRSDLTLVNVSSSPAHKLLKASLEPFCLVLASILSFVATRIECGCTSAFTSTGFKFSKCNSNIIFILPHLKTY